ncbi:formylglycine-generating enzyme family protein [bacterium]|nr:formylglycine-generating enzyme family protein [bacterium]MCI0603090.1 formylglycine-generating enzyme family protein [bacterium]
MERKGNEMLFIPGGEFEMGISPQEAENLVREFFHPDDEINPYLLYTETPNRKVRVQDFSISKYEITNREYKEFVDAGGYANKDLWRELVSIQELNTALMGWERIELFRDHTGNPGPASWENGTYPEGTADHPVNGVSWFEAMAYCRWKKCRLPTEAEWEYAARGADQRMFPWGNSTDVGVLEDKSPFGVVDMAGKVSEWVAETWYPYPNSPLGKLEKVEEEYGIIRGGNYLSEAFQMRTTYRERTSRLDTSMPVGFRCAR